jgi:hypothetical protein
MKSVKTLAAGAAMTLFLAVPVALVGCGGMSPEERCEDFGKACGQTAEQIQSCKDAAASGETSAEAVGCGSQYSDLLDCSATNYSTPSADQCSSASANDQCGAEATAYLACVLTACSADPSKPGCTKE